MEGDAGAARDGGVRVPREAMTKGGTKWPKETKKDEKDGSKRIGVRNSLP